MASTIALLLHTDAALAEAREQLEPPLRPHGLRQVRQHRPLFRSLSGVAERPAAFPGPVPRVGRQDYCPGECRAAVELLEPPAERDPLLLQAVAGQPDGFRVRCTNTSVKPWVMQPRHGDYNAGVHLGWMVFNDNDEDVREGRSGLFDAVVPPGETIELTAALPPLPAGTLPRAGGHGRRAARLVLPDGRHGAVDVAPGGPVKKKWRLLGSVILVAVLAWRIDWRRRGRPWLCANWAAVDRRAGRLPVRPGRQQRALADAGPRPGLRRIAEPLSRLLLHRHVLQPAVAHVDRRRHGAHVVSRPRAKARPCRGRGGGRRPFSASSATGSTASSRWWRWRASPPCAVRRRCRPGSAGSSPASGGAVIGVAALPWLLAAASAGQAALGVRVRRRISRASASHARRPRCCRSWCRWPTPCCSGCWARRWAARAGRLLRRPGAAGDADRAACRSASTAWACASWPRWCCCSRWASGRPGRDAGRAVVRRLRRGQSRRGRRPAAGPISPARGGSRR